MFVIFVIKLILTYFRSMFLPHENRTFDFPIKSIDWILLRADIAFERVKNMLALFAMETSYYSFVIVQNNIICSL